MAYINQETKQSISTLLKPVLTKYGMKGTLSVRNHSTLILTLSSGVLDIIGNHNEVLENNSWGERPGTSNSSRKAEGYIQVNVYHVSNSYSGKVREFLEEVLSVMNRGNRDNSDISTDYFDVGWYVSLFVGKWVKPYSLTS